MFSPNDNSTLTDHFSVWQWTLRVPCRSTATLTPGAIPRPPQTGFWWSLGFTERFSLRVVVFVKTNCHWVETFTGQIVTRSKCTGQTITRAKPPKKRDSVWDHTQFKNKRTICSSSCGLFLTCREENRISFFYIIIYTYTTMDWWYPFFYTMTSIVVWPTWVTRYVVGASMMWSTLQKKYSGNFRDQ
jgi:hypothetical protein